MTLTYWKGRLIHDCQRWLAVVLARCRLHHVCCLNQNGEAVVTKSRRFVSHIPIRMGNRLLKRQKCGVEILRNDEWIRWENEVHALMELASCRQKEEFSAASSHVLTRPHVSGFSLRDILKEARYSDELKFSAVGWAVESLCQLHRRRADWGSGVIQSVTHGDATANNVIVNFDSQKATWIDFDIRHLPFLSDLDRRADDLRALIFSAAACLTASRFPRLVETAIASFDDRALLTRFRERLTNDWARLNTFQLAQSPLNWNAKNLLTKLLLNQSADRPLILAAATVESD